MAPAGKFSHPASMVAVSGVLILLSVLAAGERQCSWCGPLADQVHRSQRAPSCDEPGVTTCENGLSHCAIIASSPPYFESRLCVKYYQDECYSIFCNSSKTWRMTCPCRGDLCNKEKTEREHEAFAFLATLGSKIQNLRIKKRTVTLGKFISRNPNRTAIVTEENGTNNTHQTKPKNLLTDQDTMTEYMAEANAIIDQNNNETKTNNNQSDLRYPNTNGREKNMNLATDINERTENSAMEKNNANNMTNTSRNENEILGVTSPANLNEMQNDMPAITETPVSITQVAGLASISDVISSEIPTMDTLSKDINIDVPNNIDHTAESKPTEKTIDEKIALKMDIKPSVGLPAAEALQQNSSPSAVTDKILPTTEQTTTETTNKVMKTTEEIHVTTTSEPTKIKKNNAVTISLNLLPTLLWVMLYV